MKEPSLILTEEETIERRDAALLRALSTPHKRQKEMKVGKHAASPKRPGKAQKPTEKS